MRWKPAAYIKGNPLTCDEGKGFSRVFKSIPWPLPLVPWPIPVYPWGFWIVMPMFGSEPWFKPEPTRTGPRFGSGFKEIIEPHPRSRSRFREQVMGLNLSEPGLNQTFLGRQGTQSWYFLLLYSTMTLFRYWYTCVKNDKQQLGWWMRVNMDVTWWWMKGELVWEKVSKIVLRMNNRWDDEWIRTMAWEKGPRCKKMVYVCGSKYTYKHFNYYIILWQQYLDICVIFVVMRRK